MGRTGLGRVYSARLGTLLPEKTMRSGEHEEERNVLRVLLGPPATYATARSFSAHLLVFRFNEFD